MRVFIVGFRDGLAVVAVAHASRFFSSMRGTQAGTQADGQNGTAIGPQALMIDITVLVARGTNLSFGGWV
jgi:hypothetical protein